MEKGRGEPGTLEDLEAALTEMPDCYGAIEVIDHPDDLSAHQRKVLSTSDFLVQNTGVRDAVMLRRNSNEFYEVLAVAKREGLVVTVLNNAHFTGGGGQVYIEAYPGFRMLFRHQPFDQISERPADVQ